MNLTYRSTAALTFASALLLAGAAFAGHDERDRQPDIRAIAHELEDAAKDLHRRAERTAHHPSYRQERALRRLHELEERADHFHRQVEGHYQSASHTYHDYLELRESFDGARRAMPALHATGEVEREIYRVEVLMNDLEAYYRPMLRSRYGGHHYGGAWRTRSGIRFRLWR